MRFYLHSFLFFFFGRKTNSLLSKTMRSSLRLCASIKTQKINGRWLEFRRAERSRSISANQRDQSPLSFGTIISLISKGTLKKERGLGGELMRKQRGALCGSACDFCPISSHVPAKNHPCVPLLFSRDLRCASICKKNRFGNPGVPIVPRGFLNNITPSAWGVKKHRGREIAATISRGQNTQAYNPISSHVPAKNHPCVPPLFSPAASRVMAGSALRFDLREKSFRKPRGTIGAPGFSSQHHAICVRGEETQGIEIERSD